MNWIPRLTSYKDKCYSGFQNMPFSVQKCNNQWCLGFKPGVYDFKPGVTRLKVPFFMHAMEQMETDTQTHTESYAICSLTNTKFAIKVYCTLQQWDVSKRLDILLFLLIPLLNYSFISSSCSLFSKKKAFVFFSELERIGVKKKSIIYASH